MNIQTSNARPLSEIQQEKADLDQEKAALQKQVAQLTEDKKNLMLAVTDLFEMVLPLLQD